MKALYSRTRDPSISGRLLQRRAAQLCIVIRNASVLCAALTFMLDADTATTPVAMATGLALALWSTYRLATRSAGVAVAAVDYAWVLALAAAIPILQPSETVTVTTGVAQVVTAVGIATLTVQIAPRYSTPLAVVAIAVYANATASLIGWAATARLNDLYALVTAWLTALLVRRVVAVLALARDEAYRHRVAAQVEVDVSAAVEAFRRAQLSRLHDTVAATLVLVTGVERPPADLLARRAARDLTVLNNTDLQQTPEPAVVDVVGTLAAVAKHHHTPVQLTGIPRLLVDGDVADALEGATTEALNNVDRHANAERAVVDISHTKVRIRDDGTGFDDCAPSSGWGLKESIRGRMERIGGSAAVESTDRGTCVTLSLPDRAPVSTVELTEEADRTILLAHTAFGVGVTCHAVAQLGFTAPWGLATAAHPVAEAVVAVLIAACALATLAGVLRDRWRPAAVSVAVLAVISVVQPAVISTADLQPGFEWTEAAIGFVLIPFLVRYRFRWAAVTLMAFWLVPVAIDLIRAPRAATVQALAFDASAFLVAQLGLCAFGILSRLAAWDARAEYREVLRLTREQGVAAGMRAEYDRRYAQTVKRVSVLLTALRDGEPVTPELRARARTELGGLRELFALAGADVEHVALQKIRFAIRRAEGRGVDVCAQVDLQPERIADPIVSAVVTALDDATDFARVVVTATGGAVTASVVHGFDGGPSDRTFDPDVDVVTLADRRWVSTRVESGRAA